MRISICRHVITLVLEFIADILFFILASVWASCTFANVLVGSVSVTYHTT